MDRPELLPEWAVDETIDPISGQLNVVEPPQQRKDSGWQRREIPPRQWQNWLLRTIYRWVEYLDYRSSRVDSYTVSQLPASPSTANGTPIAFVYDIPALAYFDGADWRRADTNGVI